MQMTNRIYFDNSATTVVYPEVKDIVCKVMTEDFGNPSSMHMAGVEAERYMREARRVIAKTLHAREKEIFFTSGGTESNNWALIGGAMAMRRAGMHIVTQKTEHPSVMETMKHLAEMGFSVTYVDVDEWGRVLPQELARALTGDTVLVSLMAVNNEVGAFNDPAVFGPLIHEKSPHALYHVDAVQAYGKYDINVGACGIDLLSVSSHKIHGPKGVGVLYKKESAKLLPYIYGGGQQDGMRSGTDNVPGIAGLGKAAEIAYRDLVKNREHLYEVTGYMRERLSSLPEVVLHGKPGKESAPHIVNASFPGVGSEVLLHALEDYGICVSAGSACSTHKKTKSPTLTAMGCSAAELDSMIRFSLCEMNTKEEVDVLTESLGKLLPVLRRYRAR